MTVGLRQNSTPLDLVETFVRELPAKVQDELLSLRGVVARTHGPLPMENMALFQWSTHPQGDLTSSTSHPEGYSLFRQEDIWAWVIFTVVFILLVLFDNVVLHRKHERISFNRACMYTLFWISTAVGFCAYIGFSRGMEDAFSWGTGYLLEWMLSVDNLFVFHLVFNVYGTPDNLKHKPLFWGIIGAIVFRMIFFVIEEILLHGWNFMHIIFGLFLIYTGIKAAVMDDDDEDPRKNKFFLWLSKRIRFVNVYDANAQFFVKVRIDNETGEVIYPSDYQSARLGGADGGSSRVPVYAQHEWYEETPRAVQAGQVARTYSHQWRASLLLVVVICLEVTDVIFAVDSVSAIVAQIPDLYLAYTACVFAMLGLRAMFFVIEGLIDLFSLLKYGVAAILIFIGLKLCLKAYVHVPPWVVCCILFGTIGLCMIGSLILEKYKGKEEDEKESR